MIPQGTALWKTHMLPRKDDALVITHYNRTLQQEEMLGLQVSALKQGRMLWNYLALWITWHQLCSPL